MSMRAVNPWDWGGVEGRASRFEEGEGTAAGGQRRRSSRLRLERMREEGEEKWLVNTLQPWTGGLMSIWATWATTSSSWILQTSC